MVPLPFSLLPYFNSAGKDAARFPVPGCRGIRELMSLKRWLVESPGAGVHDGELVRQCLQGARPAWEDFAQRYHDIVERAVRHALIRLCRRASVHDVENVVQEIFSGLLEDSGRRLRTY